MDWLQTFEPQWYWLALGLILAVAEMAIPGLFLIWLAGAAIVTGLVAWMLPFSVPLQVVLFAALAIIAVYSGRRYLSDNPVVEADPLMNRRGARLVGEVAVVTQPIVAGSGRVHFGDSEWNAKGADTPSGERVKIVGSDGVTLLVEPLVRLGSEGAPA